MGLSGSKSAAEKPKLKQLINLSGGNGGVEYRSSDEEQTFLKTLKMFDSFIGSPVKWIENCAKDLIIARQNLIQSLKKHPNETLRCEALAKEYQNLVFREQYKAILGARTKSYPKLQLLVNCCCETCPVIDEN